MRRVLLVIGLLISTVFCFGEEWNSYKSINKINKESCGYTKEDNSFLDINYYYGITDNDNLDLIFEELFVDSSNSDLNYKKYYVFSIEDLNLSIYGKIENKVKTYNNFHDKKNTISVSYNVKVFNENKEIIDLIPVKQADHRFVFSQGLTFIGTKSYLRIKDSLFDIVDALHIITDKKYINDEYWHFAGGNNRILESYHLQ